MKILKVIHGYPMLYNAGSEVYSQTLCRGLAARGHDVRVFTREEDSFARDGALREAADDGEPRVRLHLVNNPRNRDRYRVNEIDERFGELLDQLRPDVVHVGHLNHLSTSLVSEADRRGLPIVFTLHDYWLMCPRGQFMQMHSRDVWAACDGQDDAKCARQCYARYFSGDPADEVHELAHWTGWVRRRMAHSREIAVQTDLFIAPSRYLKDRFERDFGLPPEKTVFLDYGFDRVRCSGRRRVPGEPFSFGYIGTHIPAKGIHLLIEAFSKVAGDCRLRIWGRDRGQDSRALRALAETLPVEKCRNIEWRSEYRNDRICADVFDHVDAIVTPSIWVENSPLVIHEAQEARVPVITADVGGMAEYVEHEVNGLLFRHRDAGDMAVQMQRLRDDPALAERLGARGYLYDPHGRIPDIDAHCAEIERLYLRAIAGRAA